MGDSACPLVDGESVLSVRLVAESSCALSEGGRPTPPLSVVTAPLVVGEFSSSSSRTGALDDRSPRHASSPRLRGDQHARRPVYGSRPGDLSRLVGRARTVASTPFLAGTPLRGVPVPCAADLAMTASVCVRATRIR